MSASIEHPEVELRRVHDVLDHEPRSGEHWVLVDRLWPRGVKKERLHLDRWDKDVAPSDELRRAFHHEDIGLEEFRTRYQRELEDSGACEELLSAAREAKATTVVLLIASKDVEHSQGPILRERLQAMA